MQALPRPIVDRFASEFSGAQKGFSAQEITDYFRRYSNLIRTFEHYPFRPTRIQLFVESVYSLPPKLQYYALNDLTWIEYDSRYTYPNEDIRLELRTILHNFISPTPIGIMFSQIRDTAFREDWITCYSRLQNNPSSCITSARTMLETILRTIISESNNDPESSGELARLLRQTEDVLGFNRQNRHAEHQILQGLASIIHGISSISNSAGDRHGLIGGDSIDNPYYAQLCMNAAGTIGLAFIEMFLLNNPRSQINENEN